jgi:hypothetical protein
MVLTGLVWDTENVVKAFSVLEEFAALSLHLVD